MSAEPPQHVDCARYAATACSFLSDPQRERRDRDLPPEALVDDGMITRNPGVVALWVTRTYHVIDGLDGRRLLQLGQPQRVEWFRCGRSATREEVVAAFEAGCPTLMQLAEEEGPDAVALFHRMRAAAERLWPAEQASERRTR